jgi:hypothetical protein
LRWASKMIENILQRTQFNLERRPAKRRPSMWFEDFTCTAVTRDPYISCVKIRCQETDSEHYNRLRTLVGATVDCKLRKLAVAL